MMRIVFVLPGPSSIAAGGPRIVFQYANALAAKGLHAEIIMVPGLRQRTGLRFLVRKARYWLLRLSNGYRPDRWQLVDPRVKLHWWPDLMARRSLPADAVVATSVQTAEAIARWPPYSGRKFYFVQGYETWDFPPERIHKSWRLPLHVITISKWLEELLAESGVPAAVVPNPLDHEVFGIDMAPAERSEPILVFPWHERALKGSRDVVEAVRRLTVEFPDLQVWAFGVDAQPRYLGVPSFRYLRSPAPAEMRRLLNRAQVAVAPSHQEGWGLPACEALQCGCALAASDIGGHRAFLRHESNALLYPAGDSVMLEQNLRRLLTDRTLRQKLALQGATDMQKYNVEESVRLFIVALTKERAL